MLLKDEILEQSGFIRYYKNKALAQGREEGLAQGLEKGLEQGLEQGLAKGLAKGLEQGRRGLLEVIRQLLGERFPGLRLPASLTTRPYAELQSTLIRLAAAQDRPAAQAALKPAKVK